jgi:hypothetical protein
MYPFLSFIFLISLMSFYFWLIVFELLVPNAKLKHPATPHAVNLCKHHLLKRLECGAPSSEGEFAMHPSGNGQFIRLCHKALWAWARKMDKPDVIVDIPPKTPLFEWQVACPTRSTTKRKNAPASEVSGSPAS